jgi:hypothetical protein
MGIHPLQALGHTGGNIPRVRHGPNANPNNYDSPFLSEFAVQDKGPFAWGLFSRSLSLVIAIPGISAEAQRVPRFINRRQIISVIFPTKIPNEKIQMSNGGWGPIQY